MEDNKEFIDVEYTDFSDTIFLTAPQIAKEIKDIPERVRYWGKTYGDLCGVKLINGRMKYTKETIEYFRYVRELVDDKRFSKEQIRECLQKRGEGYGEFDGGLIDIKDPLGFQALASSLTIEVENKLNEFLENMNSKMLESNKILANTIQEQVAITVDEVISDKMDEYFNNLKEELNVTKEMNEKLDTLKSIMEERKRESEKEEKKSWIKKIFG